MLVEYDVPVAVDDGTVLRADASRRGRDAGHLVLIARETCAKDLAFQDGYPGHRPIMTEQHTTAHAPGTQV
jgi:hypothetical protein